MVTQASNLATYLTLIRYLSHELSEISSAILAREVIVSPHSENPGLLLLKYREYLQKLYSLDT